MGSRQDSTLVDSSNNVDARDWRTRVNSRPWLLVAWPREKQTSSERGRSISVLREARSISRSFFLYPWSPRAECTSQARPWRRARLSRLDAQHRRTRIHWCFASAQRHYRIVIERSHSRSVTYWPPSRYIEASSPLDPWNGRRAVSWIKFLQFHVLALRKNWSKSARRRRFANSMSRGLCAMRAQVVTLGERYSSRKLNWQGYIEMEYVSLRRANASHKILQLPIWINKYVIQIRTQGAWRLGEIMRVVTIYISHGKYFAESRARVNEIIKRESKESRDCPRIKLSTYVP